MFQTKHCLDASILPDAPKLLSAFRACLLGCFTRKKNTATRKEYISTLRRGRISYVIFRAARAKLSKA
jgi:hypothetical protein